MTPLVFSSTRYDYLADRLVACTAWPRGEVERQRFPDGEKYQLVEAAAERLEQRGIAELSNPGALRQELRRSLLIESATPDSISVSMKGSRPESTMVVLDTLVTAMVSTANAGRAQRPDGIAAEVAKAA